MSYIFITYSSLISDVFALKTDLFYICQNALLALDYEDLSVNKYTVQDELLKKHIEDLLHLNYTSIKTNFKTIRVKEIYIIDDNGYTAVHTQNRYDSPILHLDISVTYNYTITKTEKSFNIHEDIKLNSLTVGDINE